MIRSSPRGITFNRLLQSSQGLLTKDPTLRKLLQVLVASGSVSASRLSSSSVEDTRWANLKHLPILYKALGSKPRFEVGVRAYLHYRVSFDYDPSLPYQSILDETDWVGLSHASLAQGEVELIAVASLEDLLVHTLDRWNSPASAILRPLSIMLYSTRRFDTEYLSSRAFQKGLRRPLQRFQASFKKAFLRIKPGQLSGRPNLMKVRSVVLENHPELRWVKAPALIETEEVLDLSTKEAISS
jgi:hypothetical protein